MQIRNKMIITAATSFVILTLASFGIGQSRLSEYQKVSTINNGAATCFQRVSQSFTAAMVKDTASIYLQRDFTDLTSECLAEVMTQFQSVYSQAFEKAHKPLNNLINETHWFHQKLFRVQSQIQTEQFEPAGSNIVGKYAALETMRADFQDAIDAKLLELNSSANVWGTMTWVFSALVMLSFGLLAFILYSNQKVVHAINSQASKMLDERDFMATQVDSLMEDGLKTFDLKSLYELFAEHHADLLEGKVTTSQVSTDEAPAKEKQQEKITIPEVTLEVTSEKQVDKKEDIKVEVEEAPKEEVYKGISFNETFNTVFERVQNQAFSSGVIIDFDLEENLWVEEESEGLLQVLMTMMSYALNASSAVESFKKIMVRSESLDSRLIVRYSIVGHYFNVSELEYMSHHSNTSHDTAMDLILLKELAQDSLMDLKVLNKINDRGELWGAIIELDLKRIEAPSSEKKRVSKIIRGTKKEILNQL
jgi:hypothetical protein